MTLKQMFAKNIVVFLDGPTILPDPNEYITISGMIATSPSWHTGWKQIWKLNGRKRLAVVDGKLRSFRLKLKPQMLYFKLLPP